MKYTLTHLEALTDEELTEKLAEFMGWSHWDHPGYDACWYNPADSKRTYIAKFSWKPLEDESCAKDVLIRMREHWGCTYSIRLLANKKTAVEFHDKHGMIAGQYRHKNHFRAIALAALLTLS